MIKTASNLSNLGCSIGFNSDLIFVFNLLMIKKLVNYFCLGWILKKIGHINAMSLVLFAFGIRFLLYSMLTDPWWCLPVELLNGLTFGIFYATMASYASIVAPPGTETTIQGLVGAIFEGIGKQYYFLLIYIVSDSNMCTCVCE